MTTDANTLLERSDAPLPASWTEFIADEDRARSTTRQLLFEGVPPTYFATNPAKPLPLPDGRVVQLLREQLDPKHRPEGMPMPGPSQVGVYVADGSNFASFSPRRAHTLFAGSPNWCEDPAVAQIGSDTIVSCVDVTFARRGPIWEMTAYHTRFHRFDLVHLTASDEIARGPKDMKDIRLFELDDGAIGVLTRPRGGQYGVGYIGFVRLDSLDDLTPENILAAEPLCHPQQIVSSLPALQGFGAQVWIGANDAHRNPDGTVTVFGHFGSVGPYGAIRFQFDPTQPQRSVSNVAFVALPCDFQIPDGPIRPNTVFSGGVAQLGGDRVLTVGVNDFGTGLVKLDSP